MRLSVVLVLLLLSIPATTGEATPRDASEPVTITALAVAEDERGTFVGIHAVVEAQAVAAGTGQVFVATKPLAQTDMQGSARLASRVAASTLGVRWQDYDYLVSFRADSSVIGGPSAGGVMTVALTVALHNLLEPSDPWSLDASVAGTGTINPDGTIGPVGGVPAKAEGAQEAGIRTFLYPAGLDTATTQVQGRTVAVDMQAHCAELAITCRPVATLSAFLEAAAGVRILHDAIAVPGTADYAAVLEPSVAQQAEALAERVQALQVRDLSGLSSTQRARVQDDAATAQERLDAAREALQAGTYYLAATRSFQGAIAAGRAERSADFYASGLSADVVAQAVQDCAAAAQGASDLADGLRADGLTALYAVASAQERVQQTFDLLEEAQAYYPGRQTQSDWTASLAASAFCVERAGTVSWWAGLREAFAPGPILTDSDGLASDLLDEAGEAVAYADAVLGDGAAADALQLLANGRDHAAASRPDAAVLAAIEAQTSAAVALQTGSGASAVPAEVLEAAQQAAARAIAAARAQGIEPMLSVSLVELAQDQQDAAALTSLWNARSLALLESAPAQPTFEKAPVTEAVGQTVTVLVVGIVLGAAASGAVVAVVALTRRR